MINRITSIRIYILVAILTNLIFSIIRPELETAYNTAGFQMIILFLLSLI